MGRNILYILLLAVGISVQDVKAYEYTDSLTSITLTLPDSADIEHKQGFQRARIKLEKSDIDVYSMKSQNGTQFSWERVNSFDNNRKYGELVRYERMPNGIDGWIRYYSAKDKRGRQYTTCVVLLRGKNYAFYMTESVYNEEDLSITDILETASFPTEFKKKKILVPSWLAWTIYALLAFSQVIFFPLLKKVSKRTYIVIAIFAVIAALLWSVFILDKGWFAILIALGCAACWGITYNCNSWKEAFEKIMNAIGKSS